VGVDGYGADAEFVGRPKDTDGDLTAVRNKQLTNLGHWSMQLPPDNAHTPAGDKRNAGAKGGIFAISLRRCNGCGAKVFGRPPPLG
jgi:hypothetical protein